MLQKNPLQVCRQSDREDMMLLCDRCDNGYHMDCLNPPMEYVPIEDWFCPQCDGTQATATLPVRRPASLTLRVRQAVARNRQVVLRESNAGRKTATPKKTTRRKVAKRRKTQSKKRKTTPRKRKVKRKGRKKNVAVVPSPRKRIATALGIQEKFSLPVALPAQLSLFGDSNALMDDNEYIYFLFTTF